MSAATATQPPASIHQPVAVPDVVRAFSTAARAKREKNTAYHEAIDSGYIGIDQGAMPMRKPAAITAGHIRRKSQ